MEGTDEGRAIAAATRAQLEALASKKRQLQPDTDGSPGAGGGTGGSIAVPPAASEPPRKQQVPRPTQSVLHEVAVPEGKFEEKEFDEAVHGEGGGGGRGGGGGDGRVHPPLLSTGLVRAAL